MWEALKNALISVKEALGIEIPGLPADLGPLGETATTVVQEVADSATAVGQEVADSATAVVQEAAAGVVDGSAAITDAVTGLPLGGGQST